MLYVTVCLLCIYFVYNLLALYFKCKLPSLEGDIITNDKIVGFYCIS